MSLTKFKKDISIQPRVYEAIQWTGDNIHVIWDALGTSVYGPIDDTKDIRLNYTSSEELVCHVSDWILRAQNDWLLFPVPSKTFEIEFKPLNENELSLVCQHCLADQHHSSQHQNPKMRCPVCMCSYNGPGRHEEFKLLSEAGLVRGLDWNRNLPDDGCCAVTR